MVRQIFRAVLKIVGVLAVMAVIILLAIPPVLYFYYRRFVYTSIEAVTDQPIDIMVLGAGLGPDASPSNALQERLNAAVQLYEKKNVKTILVSGAKDSEYYNEPKAMKAELVKAGIPEEKIIEDGGGYRTYDSCNRAKNEYKYNSLVVVSQGFHLPRALFLCKALGIQATGVFSTGSFSTYYSRQYTIREIAAMYVAVWDVMK